MPKPSGPITLICGYDPDGYLVAGNFDALGNLKVLAEVSTIDAANVTYTPSTLTDWNGSADPGNQNSTNDQLASRVKVLEAADLDDFMPVRFQRDHHDSFVVIGNAIATLLNAAQYNNGYWYQNAPANGDVFTFSAILKAGAYTLKFLGLTYVNGGKCDIDFKHVNDAGYTSITTAQDWYSATSTYNTPKTATFTVVTSGRQIFKVTVNGKNAASGGYGIVLTIISAYLTDGDS